MRGGDGSKKIHAGVAQLVERNLAKVEVESSRLFSRSNFKTGSSGFPFLSVPTVSDLALTEILAEGYWHGAFVLAR